MSKATHSSEKQGGKQPATSVPAPQEDSVHDPNVSSLLQPVEMADVKEMLMAVALIPEQQKRIEEDDYPSEPEEVPNEALSVVSDVQRMGDRVAKLEILAGEISRSSRDNMADVARVREELSTLAGNVASLTRMIERALFVESSITREEDSSAANPVLPDDPAGSERVKTVLTQLAQSTNLKTVMDVSAKISATNSATGAAKVARRRRD